MPRAIKDRIFDVLNNGYPTPEEIMSANQTFKPGVLKIVRAWKTLWRSATTEHKRAAFVQVLANQLSELYKKPFVGIALADKPFGERGTYNPRTRTITLSPPVSILTSLHEIAHHLFGASERQATIWSVHLFKRVWPKAFAALKWEGHVLVKNTTMPKKTAKRPAPKKQKALAPASSIASFELMPVPRMEGDDGPADECMRCCKRVHVGVVIMGINEKGNPIKGFLCKTCAKAWAKKTKEFWAKAEKAVSQKTPAKMETQMKALNKAVTDFQEDAEAVDVGDTDDEEDYW